MLKPCVLYMMLGVTESLLWVEANPGVLLSALLLSCSSCVLTGRVLTQACRTAELLLVNV